jgi:hypothetical protein
MSGAGVLLERVLLEQVRRMTAVCVCVVCVCVCGACRARAGITRQLQGRPPSQPHATAATTYKPQP